MRSWESLYREDIEAVKNVDVYIKNKLKYKKKFLKKIFKYADKNSKIIETGCGTGLVSGYLQSLGYDVTAIDISEEVLNLAREVSEKSKIIVTPKFLRKNIFKLDFPKEYFNVAFSNGVLEHFSDEEIIKTLKEQLKIARIVIIGVPSVYFDETEKMYGDERNIIKEEWKRLIKFSGGLLLEEDGFHYYPWYKRIFEFKKYFRPKAFHLFVIKKQTSKEEI